MTPYEQQRAVVDALSARLAEACDLSFEEWGVLFGQHQAAEDRLIALAADPAPSRGGTCWQCGKATFPAPTSTGRDCADGCTARVDVEVRCAA